MCCAMWDEDYSDDASAKTDLGSGALTKAFGGIVRGIGRGSVNSGQTNEDNSGSKVGGFGGFGGKSRGGFNRTNDENSSSGSRERSNGNSGGFGGGSRSGFGRTNDENSSSGFGERSNGSSGGFGGGSRGGLGGKTNDENSSSGFGERSNGFGGGSRGGFGGKTNNENSSSGFGERSNGFGGGSRGGFGGRTNNENSSSGFGEGSNDNSGGFGGGSRGGFGGSSGSGERGGGNGRKEGEWICPNTDCGHVNFKFRKCCQKCDTSKPDDGGSSSDFGGRSSGRGRSDGGNGRRGDWVCANESCGNKNFAFRKNCQKCDTPKPDTGDDDSSQDNFGTRSGGFGGGFGSSGDGGRERRGNEWTCPNSECGHKNFAFRTACQKCETPKDTSGDDPEDKPREAPYVPPTPSDKEEDIFSGAVQKGINFDKYDDIPVEVSGRNQCGVINSFEEASFYPTFLRNIKRANYEKPTPIQKYSIPIITAGRDLMACAQTGSGKTAAFLLPVLTAMIKNGLTTDQFQKVQTPQAIIVAPTRELVLQIHNDCRKFAFQTDIKPVVVYGGTSLGHQMRQIESGAHIVTGTPGRLLDIINRGKISLEKVAFLILDEADRMLDMGFEPEIRKMVETLGMPQKTQRQTFMFSATFPEEIQKLAADFLNDYLFVTVGRVGGANTDVSQNFFEVERLEKRDSLCDILNAGAGEKTLVFVETKRNADFLASYLSQTGFPTTSIHGDRLQKEREEALLDFKSGKSHVLVATSVAARGLDIPEVKHVINYDLPASIDEYVHRIGRTGRCGNLGKATSFFSVDTDQLMAPHLVRILKEARQPVPEWLAAHACGMGAGDSGSFGGRFGGKDIRSGKFGDGGQASGNSGDNWAAGIGAGCNTAAAGDDENWD